MKTPARASDPDGKGRFIHDYLGYLLGQANHALYRDFDAQVRAAGLSSTEWRVLATLYDGPPLPVNMLAREVLAKQPTVTKLVHRMVDQGWLSTASDPGDQRRTLVAISPAGRRLARPLLARARAHERSLLNTLDVAQRNALKQTLARLAARR